MQELDILILGAGWTATFLIPLLQQHRLLFAATTSDGRQVAGSPTIKWTFDPSAPAPELQASFASLPRARHVLIVFPLKGPGQSKLLTQAYTTTHSGGSLGGSRSTPFRFIQLGTTGIWQSDPAQRPWLDRRSPYARSDARTAAEDELLDLGGCVLDLAGLWGGVRDPRHWVARVATSKEAVRAKTSLHMIHGADVARVVVAVLDKSEKGQWADVGYGQRWMVTDGFVYDWWSLFAGWADTAGTAQEQEGGDRAAGQAEAEGPQRPTRQAQWVYELMQEQGVRALPRSMEALGRCYDTRELWQTLGIAPLKAGLGL